MSQVQLLRCDGSHPDFVGLTSRLSSFLAELNGEMDSFYAPLNSSDTIPTCLVAYVDGVPLGCGAFRLWRPRVAEIKRMFVDPESRGQGIGATILSELENWALELGFESAVLETSKRLTAALSLYDRAGYTFIDNFEPYVGVEDSVCLCKSL